MEERERLAQEYLDAMNSTMAEHAALNPIPDSSEGAPDMGGGGVHPVRVQKEVTLPFELEAVCRLCLCQARLQHTAGQHYEIGRASCRERV